MNRFVIAEPRLCIGCNTCMAACSQVHKAEGLQEHPRLTVMRNATVTAPILCRHCEDAWCARVCPVNAITLTNNAVELNETTCIGCKLCGIACPFGAITPAGSKPLAVPENFPEYIPMTELSDVPFSPANTNPFLAWNAGVRAVAVKCDLCSFQSQGPECVRVCPTNALILVDKNSIEQANHAKRLAAASGFANELPFMTVGTSSAISHEEQKR
ncbi:4Fe-4S dicluster domain-containing protein [Yersinia canariae]|uniref:4Fe-4S dicluster domain-containing protein n=1 Tax=Yersinia canariae TaxID=2607663 RepID=UPI0011A98B63|nr:4Fe-4S dicluster domain-containing protein [Yersinia canariae]